MLRKSMLSGILIMGIVLSGGLARADLEIVKSKFKAKFYGDIKV